MKKNILRLIQDDIKLSRLINTLEVLNISAYYYFSANSTVILSLMGIEDCEDVQEGYNQRIEQACELENYDTVDKVQELAEEVYEFLLTFES